MCVVKYVRLLLCLLYYKAALWDLYLCQVCDLLFQNAEHVSNFKLSLIRPKSEGAASRLSHFSHIFIYEAGFSAK